MKKNVIRIALCAILFALCVSAEAQQPTKVPRIGYLSGSSISANPHWREAFQQGLHELGYLPGLQSVE
jgi:hypothetical protein